MHIKLLMLAAYLGITLFATREATAAEIRAAGVAEIRISGTGNIYFGVTGAQPPGTCSNYGEYFRFTLDTEGRKAMLSALLAAKLADKAVWVWYDPTTSPPGAINNDCVPAVAWMVSIP